MGISKVEGPLRVVESAAFSGMKSFVTIRPENNEFSLQAAAGGKVLN